MEYVTGSQNPFNSVRSESTPIVRVMFKLRNVMPEEVLEIYRRLDDIAIPESACIPEKFLFECPGQEPSGITIFANFLASHMSNGEEYINQIVQEIWPGVENHITMDVYVLNAKKNQANNVYAGEYAITKNALGEILVQNII